MSSKKKLRQKRRERKTENRKPRVNPATVFMLITVAAVVLLVLIAMFRGSDRVPPRPGAVWSEAHGHWH